MNRFKTVIRVLLLIIVFTGVAYAGGIDFHMGLGFHTALSVDVAQNIDEQTGEINKVTSASTEYGMGGYIGLGFGIGIRKVLNFGMESAPTLELLYPPLRTGQFAFQWRIYTKLRPVKGFTLTLFGGFKGDPSGNLFSSVASVVSHPVLGVRLSSLIFYAEYSSIWQRLDTGTSGVTRHELGAGITFVR